jgi:hypothetical protein
MIKITGNIMKTEGVRHQCPYFFSPLRI